MEASPAVRAFRAQLRAELPPGTRLRGWLHLAFTSVASLAVLLAAALAARNVQPLEWLTVPAAFLVANAAEYFGHRGPMHHRRAGLGLLYERHTLRHHRFFAGEAQSCDSAADFGFVLFPPTLILFFIGGIAAPIALLLFLVASRNVGCLFVATAMGYFLTYEWLHWSYHVPDGSWIGRLPVVRALRRHHALHHDMRRMAHENFNITFPICDFLFGTMARPERPKRRGGA